MQLELDGQSLCWVSPACIPTASSWSPEDQVEVSTSDHFFYTLKIENLDRGGSILAWKSQ